jgi:hypothetical protein
MAYKIDDVPIPSDIKLSEFQANSLAEYRQHYGNLEKDPKNRLLINHSLNSLAGFLKSLTPELQNKFRLWYRYQLTFIDPTMVAAAKMAKIVTKAGVKEDLAIDEKGEKFFIRADSQSIEKIKAAIEEELPSLKYKMLS